jgi:TRAP-type C4-dicarboxylate transport system permease small subunit
MDYVYQLIALIFFFFIFKYSWDGYKEFKVANDERKSEIKRMWLLFLVIAIIFIYIFFSDK